MVWQLTEFGDSKEWCISLKEYLSDKSKDWLPEGSPFFTQDSGYGHLYLEREHIYYNPTHQKSFCDSAVAEWKE
jgi:hypothetical protein